MDRIQYFEVNSPRWLSLEDFEGEIWRDILSFEHYYQISNYGRLKAVDRYVKNPRGSNRHLKERIISLWKQKSGYCTAILYKEGKKYAFNVHRLVANCFVENPNGLQIINHKDENPSNNCWWNLEWCTATYNLNYGTANIRKGLKLKNRCDLSVNVFQYDKNGTLINSYPSAKEAERITGIKANEILNVCNNGKSVTAGGYIWTKKNTSESVKNILNRINNNAYQYKEKRVAQYTIDGVFIREYSSVTEAANANGMNRHGISACCRHYGYYKTAGGYKWEYID